MAVLVRRFENMGKAQTKEEAVSESEDGDQAEEANEDDGADGWDGWIHGEASIKV